MMAATPRKTFLEKENWRSCDNFSVIPSFPYSIMFAKWIGLRATELNTELNIYFYFLKCHQNPNCGNFALLFSIIV